MVDEGTVQQGNGNSDQKYSVLDAKNIKWKVLGADEQTGELLIVAADALKNLDNSTKKFILRGLTGYSYGTDELNKICQIYGKGKGATGARSINYDDVATVIGRKKGINTSSYTYKWTVDSNTKHAPTYDSGKNYTKFWHTIADEESIKKYKDSNPKDKSLLKTTSVGVFNFYNTVTGKWETNTQELNGLAENKTIGTVKSDYLGYNSITSEQKATKGYEIIFKTDLGEEIAGSIYKDGVWQGEDNNIYWLASSYCSLDGYYVRWGLYNVYAGGKILGGDTHYSFGYVRNPNYGIRPVVSLDSDIQLEAN